MSLMSNPTRYGMRPPPQDPPAIRELKTVAAQVAEERRIRMVTQEEETRVETPVLTVEANVFATSPDGYKVHFKLQIMGTDDTNAGLISLDDLLLTLKQNGYRPEGQAAPAPVPVQAPERPNLRGNGGVVQQVPAGAAACPQHGTSRVKASKDGGLYCATKVGDGWCQWKG